MILLDSDVAVDILRGVPPAVSWFSNVPDSHEIAVPGYVALELSFGGTTQRDRRGCREVLRGCQIAWLDETNGQRALELLIEVRPRVALGAIDALVAQTARAMHTPLHTFNAKHFRAVPDLELIQPYTR
jgi:hypothetical protein